MSQEVELVFDDGSFVSYLGRLQIEEFWYEPAREVSNPEDLRHAACAPAVASSYELIKDPRVR
jgi:hypothetical protein